MIRRYVATMASAVLVAAGAVVGLTVAASPAQAAYCSTGSSVNVAVDFGALGGGVSTACGTGQKAVSAFTSAGFTLEDVPGQTGFVCRVQGKPAAGERCEGTNSYWALFVSTQGGSWSYASQGVRSLGVDPGDSVAFVWQSSGKRTAPSVAPAKPVSVAVPSATPKPTTKPTKKATKAPTKAAAKAGTTSVTPSATATLSASVTVSPSASATPTRSASAMPSTVASATVPTAAPTTGTASAEASTSTDAAPAAATTESDSGGVPAWVLVVIVGVLAGASSIVAWRRRQLR